MNKIGLLEIMNDKCEVITVKVKWYFKIPASHCYVPGAQREYRVLCYKDQQLLEGDERYVPVGKNCERF